MKCKQLYEVTTVSVTKHAFRISAYSQEEAKKLVAKGLGRSVGGRIDVVNPTVKCLGVVSSLKKEPKISKIYEHKGKKSPYVTQQEMDSGRNQTSRKLEKIPSR